MMKLTVDDRKTILGAVAGFLLFACVIYLFDTNKNAEEKVSEKDIEDVVSAYQDAMSANESKEFLDELNRGLMKEYGLAVSYRSTDGKFIVKNKAGNTIRVV